MILTTLSSEEKELIESNIKRKCIDSSSPLDQYPTVKQLIQFVKPIYAKNRCLDVLEIFINDEELFIAPIIDDNNIPIGLIDRGRLTEIFFKPYARYLHQRKSISDIMITDPIIIDVNSSIDDLASITINAGMRHMANGFIIIENGIYAGMTTGHKLLEEITKRKQQELYYLAHYDQLTGIPNRLLLTDRLLKACQNSKRNKHHFALIYVDLDHFKTFNDSLGHSFGDQLLIATANRLVSILRESDTVARQGGDEFVLILKNLSDINDAEAIAANILVKMREPLLIFGREVQMTASVGVALFRQLSDETVEGLMRKADAAMYEAKKQGRNTYVMYSETFDQQIIEQDSLKEDLKFALQRNEFSLHYQPQIELENNKVTGVEALLRWHHPRLGLIPPAKFIPIAEESGLIISIGEWVFSEACKQHKRWQELSLPPLRIAINVSAIQFRHHDLYSSFKKIIEVTEIDPQYIELELTESAIMANHQQAVETLNKLRDLGIKLAIDDFGTGHSSLSYLSRFPIDRIKIDQSFVRNIQNIPSNEAIVRAIIAIGHGLGLELIAEGIETVEELECIRNHQSQEVQGFLFSKPVPATEFMVWYQQVLGSKLTIPA